MTEAAQPHAARTGSGSAIRTITVLGTGTMGSAFARRLVAAGFETTAWNRTPARARPLERDGVAVADDLVQAVSAADVVLTMVLDADATLELARQFLPGARPGAIWLQSATIGIDGTRRAAALADDHGITFVDGPVLGTKDPAEHGQVTVLAAGPRAAREALGPVFGAYAAKTVDAGDAAGSATGLKLACNTWLAALTTGTAQAMAVAQTLGIDPRLFLEAIRDTASDSPYAQVKGASILDGDFDPQFAAAGMLKDLRLARTAVGDQIDPVLLDATINLYDSTVSDGHGGEDVASVAKAMRAAPAPAGVTRGPAHVGLTVPDLDEATRFLVEGLGAKISYTTFVPGDAPREGRETEEQLDLPAGSALVGQRYLKIGTGPGIELFQARADAQQAAASLTDIGWEHLAFYVDDIDSALERLVGAGGRAVSAVHGNSTYEDTPGNGSVYVRAPWGSLIELQTYPAGLYYPSDSETPRWTPPASSDAG